MKKLLITLLKIIIFFIGWAVLIGVLDVPSNQPAIWRFWAEFIPFMVMVVFSILFWLIEKRNVPIIKWNSPVKNIIIGILAGACWILIPILILKITGTITFTGSNSINMLPVWLFSCLLNVIMQELLVRGYIYQMLKKNYNFPVAIFVSTALFTVMHGGAFEEGIIPVLCVITMSIAMTLVMEYSGSLLAPIIMHFIWNGVGAIICNVVTLADDYPHVLNAIFSGNGIMTGGSCKIEGSLVVLAINSLLVLIFAVLFRKNAGYKTT